MIQDHMDPHGAEESRTVTLPLVKDTKTSHSLQIDFVYFCVFFDGISIHHMVSCDVPNTARNVAYTSTSTLHDFITSIFAIFYSAALQWWGDSVGRLFAVCELSRSFAHGFGRGLVTRRAIAPTLGRTGTSVKTSTYVTYVLIIPNHILAAVMATICSPWPW